jgi:hypothetical protein
MKANARIMSALPGGLKVRSLLALAVLLLAAWLIVESPLFHKTAPPGTKLTDLHSVGQFQAMFNADVGTPRLVLIFSPT